MLHRSIVAVPSRTSVTACLAAPVATPDVLSFLMLG